MVSCTHRIRILCNILPLPPSLCAFDRRACVRTTPCSSEHVGYLDVAAAEKDDNSLRKTSVAVGGDFIFQTKGQKEAVDFEVQCPIASIDSSHACIPALLHRATQTRLRASLCHPTSCYHTPCYPCMRAACLSYSGACYRVLSSFLRRVLLLRPRCHMPIHARTHMHAHTHAHTREADTHSHSPCTHTVTRT